MEGIISKGKTSVLDLEAQSENMKKSVTQAVSDLFPIKGKNRTLRLNNVWVSDERDPLDFAAQKAAKLKGRSYATPVYASLELIDNDSNKILDSVKRIKLAELPVYTPRAGFIVKGNEYQVTNQLRLRPGVYTQYGADGRLASQLNMARGRNMKVFLEPETGIFTLNVGTSNIKLYPILADLGISDSELEASWGSEVLKVNKEAAAGVQSTEISKLYRNLFYGAVPKTREDAISRVETYFSERTEIDPEITKITLGAKHGKLNPELLVDTTKKLLKVSRNEEKADDRNDLAFKSIHSVDDFLAERLKKSAAKIYDDLSRNIDKTSKASIPEIISTKAISKPIESLFTQTQLSSTPEQINPMHMVAGLQKVTLYGEGGITEKALTAEARGVHPSQLGFIDIIQTPESHSAGALLRLPAAARKHGNVLKTIVVDRLTGETEEYTPQEIKEFYVAFPEEFERSESGAMRAKKPYVKAMHGGELVDVPPGKIDKIYKNPKGFFNLSVNMVPFLNSDQGNRSLTAAKMSEQALPLLEREIPLVQTKIMGRKSEFKQGTTLEDDIPKDWNVATFAPVDGEVTKIDDEGSIYIKPSKGGKSIKLNTYKDFPLNSKHFLNSEISVKKGDKVKAGQTLADTNYSKDGKLALGTNLNVAYMPFKGYNFEDGLVISETASKKLTSLHMYKEGIEVTPDTTVNKGKFSARFPSAFTSAQLSKVAEGGVVEVGQVLNEGDPIILAMRKNIARPEDGVLADINRALVKPVRNTSVVWEKSVPGVVTDVTRYGNTIEVYIKTQEPAVVGDKLSGRHGNKGIVVKILPDGEMPRNKDGVVTDVLMNPNGVPSRINPGQVLETAAGKVAAKRGSRFLINNFNEKSNIESVEKALKSQGLTDTEPLFDGADGSKLGNIMTGKQYILKLDHAVSKKFNVRDTGGYTADETPGKGGGAGAQSIDPMMFYSLVSHGNKAALSEFAHIKSTKNDEFWRAYQLGQRLPPPKAPFAFEKLKSRLEGLGVNVEKKGHEFSLIPMTSADVAKMSNGEIQNSKLLRATGKNALEVEKGGLFDPRVTGGHGGSKWAHITLAEPMPNPIFEDAIKTVLNIKQKDYDALIAGKAKVTQTGEISEQGTLTGGRALQTMLSKINVEDSIKKLRKDAVGTKGQKLNTFNKHIRYLEALKKNNLKPEEYIIDKIPVIPPKFRPSYPTESGDLITSDVNFLYRDLILANEALKEKKALGLPESFIAESMQHLYSQQKALAGLGGAASMGPGSAGKPTKGIIEELAGVGSPKGGYYQRRVMAKRQDISARSTVVPEPALGVDEIGLPKAMMKTLYRKPVMRRLVSLGYRPLQAQEAIDNEAPIAMKALQMEAESKPVMMNRAPTLHKFNTMAFKPKIVVGKAIKVHPLVVGGFNMDFDGDTAAIHVPITDEASKETLKMLPTNNIFNPGTGDLMLVPSHEAVLGLYNLTEKGKNTSKKFKDFSAAQAALGAGEIEATDVVTIGDKRTTTGRYLVNMAVPAEHRDFDAVWTKGHMKKVLKAVANTHPNDFGSVADGLKDIGNNHATRSAVTLSLKDLQPLTAEREAIFRPAQATARDLDTKIEQAKTEKEKAMYRAEKVKLYTGLTPKIDGLLRKLPRTNNVFRMIDSGARGDYTQARQLMASTMLVADTAGNIIPHPIKGSYSEGLNTPEYYLQSFGTRKGVVDKSLQTSVPGYFSKRLINAMIDTTVTTNDCGTSQGKEVSISSPEELVNRYLASGNMGFMKNTLVTSKIISDLKKKHIRTIKVRSPLTCEAKEGVCAKCFGVREHGHDSDIGDNLGVIAGQAIAEPGTQMQMRTFHTGGVAEGGIGSNLASGFQRILQLSEMPDVIKGQATLSEEDGTVESIDAAPAGGNYVFVNSVRHYVPSSLRVVVKPGDKVKPGDVLSEGDKNPHHLLRLQGVRPTQDYLSDQLRREYHHQGIKLRPNIIETAVRSLTNLTRIEDPGDTDFVPGDYAPLAKVNGMIKDGKRITHTPELKGINQAPLYGNEDWLAQLNFQGLKKTIINAATKGWSSSIHGTNPIAAWAYGAEFGKGKEPGTY